VSEDGKPPSVLSGIYLRALPGYRLDLIYPDWLAPTRIRRFIGSCATSASLHHRINTVPCRFCARARTLALHLPVFVSPAGGGTFLSRLREPTDSRSSSLTLISSKVIYISVVRGTLREKLLHPDRKQVVTQPYSR